MAQEESRKKDKQEDSLQNEVKDISIDYQARKGLPQSSISEEQQKEMEKTREKLETFKKTVIKKYPFMQAIGILPPQVAEKFEEEEEVPEQDRKDKPIHIMMIIPEENFKEIPKIKAEVVKIVKDIKPKAWVHIKTPVDLFNYCLDSKYDIAEAIAMSFPLHDTGILGAFRTAQIHKSLCLRKFERYVASYVIAGSLVRGTATKTSDVDVYLVIDDTDVKRMPRLELKEKLRGIIYSYIAEAEELAGVKNVLNVQVYLLTDFWESVKDAHPVIFTFIRDGIPLYDRGTFLPWKLLLKMGRIKPSPEAIDMFMSMGDKVSETVKRRLLDIVIGDIFWGVSTPSQALLMLYGLPPPTIQELVKQMREIFVEKEKMLEPRYADILEEICIKYYKGYEHQKIKEVSGAEVDKLLKDTEDYMKRLKELREQIEKRNQEKTIEQIYNDSIQLLQGIFGKKSESGLVESFEKQFIKKGKLPDNYLHILKDIIKAREQFKKGKLARHEVEDARKNASQLINHLIEYTQRCDLATIQKSRLRLKTKDKTYELVLAGKDAFLIDQGQVQKVSEKIEKSSPEELTNALAKQENNLEVKTSAKVLEIVRKKIGDFEIIL
ncbi:MAG: nucleotidyltransferase domain-containing protein [Nanoarchaeota archaeon]|nr:nucleotidyltransferase domain-containing protein [Nanoarchaeota archaeon]MBU4086675.1 nucleotidyltransferase domain-containing protein [Nanoarchaeota archaeon]